jgi:hypothetical protein
MAVGLRKYARLLLARAVAMPSGLASGRPSKSMLQLLLSGDGGASPRCGPRL